MKLSNTEQIQDFLHAVNACTGAVWIESPDGDKYNLKSSFSQYLAIGKLLEDHAEELEVFCALHSDEAYLIHFFQEHPEV